MKKLFTNYNFDFEKNEKKLLSTFCKQTLKQVQGDNKFFAEEKAFNSILAKLNGNEETVKFTRDERTRLKFQLERNVDFIGKEMKKSWFIKRWLYKSMLKQYENIIEKYFKG